MPAQSGSGWVLECSHGFFSGYVLIYRERALSYMGSSPVGLKPTSVTSFNVNLLQTLSSNIGMLGVRVGGIVVDTSSVVHSRALRLGAVPWRREADQGLSIAPAFFPFLLFLEGPHLLFP